jgi:hypothetical protein
MRRPAVLLLAWGALFRWVEIMARPVWVFALVSELFRYFD